MKAHIKLAILLLAIFTSGTVFARGTSNGTEPTYDRIMKTKTLRCSYAVYPPGLIRDPNTGAISGIFHDLMEEIGRQHSIKIEWAEEVDYGSIIENLESGRSDVFCSNLWPSPERAQRAFFTIPALYSGVGVYVRADDVRFDGDLRKLNDPQYKISVQDGDIGDSIARADFPKAQRVSIPQAAISSLRYQDVVNQKADALFDDAAAIAGFLKEHPGALKNIAAENPVRLFPNVYMINGGEAQLKVMLDTSLQQLIYQGAVKKLMEKYAGPDGFYEVAPPFHK